MPNTPDYFAGKTIVITGAARHRARYGSMPNSRSGKPIWARRRSSASGATTPPSPAEHSCWSTQSRGDPKTHPERPD
jgi:hypothetical protein